MSNLIRVLVVDEHEIVREGLRVVFQRRPQIRVVAEACTVQGAIDEVMRSAPAVVIMDVRLRDGSGVDACRAIHERAPDTRIVMLTQHADDATVVDSILAGASAFILQDTTGDALLDAIASVAAGGSLLDPHVTACLLERLRADVTARPSDVGPLSAQERRVLALIAEGKTNKEIAAAIGLSEKTVKNYVSSILNKLRMHRRSEAAAFVARQTPQDA
ncbi:MAG TPA: response regulator transcription factor [Dehalococcoidia bacterium]|nr:response regulator transcription factor [Dehalococcoidia bacterium]